MLTTYAPGNGRDDTLRPSGRGLDVPRGDRSAQSPGNSGQSSVQGALSWRKLIMLQWTIEPPCEPLRISSTSRCCSETATRSARGAEHRRFPLRTIQTGIVVFSAGPLF